MDLGCGGHVQAKVETLRAVSRSEPVQVPKWPNLVTCGVAQTECEGRHSQRLSCSDRLNAVWMSVAAISACAIATAIWLRPVTASPAA